MLISGVIIVPHTSMAHKRYMPVGIPPMNTILNILFLSTHSENGKPLCVKWVIVYIDLKIKIKF